MRTDELHGAHGAPYEIKGCSKQSVVNRYVARPPLRQHLMEREDNEQVVA